MHTEIHRYRDASCPTFHSPSYRLPETQARVPWPLRRPSGRGYSTPPPAPLPAASRELLGTWVVMYSPCVRVWGGHGWMEGDTVRVQYSTV
jgi:hypothetical protein